MPKLCRTLALGLALLAGLGGAPAGAGLFAIKQLNLQAEILFDSSIFQRPANDASQIGLLLSGSQVRVTGHISGTEWYRISTKEVPIGYVPETVLRSLDGETLVPTPGGGYGAQEAALQPTRLAGKEYKDCEACPEMVVLPRGSFTMGANGGDITERPAHRKTLDAVVALGKYEVTVAQWMACVDAGACTYRPKAVAAPERTAVRNVSWLDAQQYVTWLSSQTGKTYRLPSEAEWEFAARGGRSTSYWWGEQVDPGMANCQDCDEQWDEKRPNQIGLYSANAFGLYDMNGGVAEWTADCWFRTHKNAPQDGAPRLEPGCPERVLRGGSWRDTAGEVKATSRRGSEENLPFVMNGFRVACNAD